MSSNIELLKYIHTTLLEKNVPLDISYKIIMRIADTQVLFDICKKNSDFLKVCKEYKSEICKNILQEWGYTFSISENIDSCELIKTFIELKKEYNIPEKNLMDKNLIYRFAKKRNDRNLIDFLHYNGVSNKD